MQGLLFGVGLVEDPADLAGSMLNVIAGLWLFRGVTADAGRRDSRMSPIMVRISVDAAFQRCTPAWCSVFLPARDVASLEARALRSRRSRVVSIWVAASSTRGRPRPMTSPTVAQAVRRPSTMGEGCQWGVDRQVCLGRGWGECHLIMPTSPPHARLRSCRADGPSAVDDLVTVSDDR